MDVQSITTSFLNDSNCSTTDLNSIIPQEILLDIFSWLNGYELSKASEVCRSWCNISRDISLKPVWGPFIKEKFPWISTEDCKIGEIVPKLHLYDQWFRLAKWDHKHLPGYESVDYFGIPKSEKCFTLLCGKVNSRIETTVFSPDGHKRTIDFLSYYDIDKENKKITFRGDDYRFEGKYTIDDVVQTDSHLIPVFKLHHSLYIINQFWYYGKSDPTKFKQFIFQDIDSIYESPVDSNHVYIEGNETKVYMINLKAGSKKKAFEYSKRFHFDALYGVSDRVSLLRGVENEGIILYLEYESTITDILKTYSKKVTLIAVSSYECAVVSSDCITIYNLKNRNVPEKKLHNLKEMDILSLCRISDRTYMASCISYLNKGMVAIWSVDDDQWVKIEKGVFNASRKDFFKHSLPLLKDSKLYAIKDHALEVYSITTDSLQKNYTEMNSKVGNLTRRRPEFEPGEAGAEAAQLE